jgi:hypothetical protein
MFFLINYLTELPNENVPKYFVETINDKKKSEFPC